MNARRLVLLLVAVLVLAACGSDAADEGASAASEPTAASEPAAAATSEAAPAASEPAASEAASGAAAAQAVEVSESDLGTILVDGEGRTLYVFDNDTDETSTCTGDCEANWPPLTGEVTAGEGVDESLLGSSEREDGSMQVTYAGHPLYYFAGDQAAGDTNGQAVGDIWWVVGPDGEKITDGEQAANSSGY